MKRDRVREVIAAYGADRSRWPKAESAEWDGLAPNDPELLAARRLDTLLSRFEAPPADRALVQRIVERAAHLPQQRPGRGFPWSLLRPRLPELRPAWPRLPWPELATMTAALALGFYIGISDIGYTDQLVATTTFGDASLTLTSSPTTALFPNGVFQ